MYEGGGCILLLHSLVFHILLYENMHVSFLLHLIIVLKSLKFHKCIHSNNFKDKLVSLNVLSIFL